MIDFKKFRKLRAHLALENRLDERSETLEVSRLFTHRESVESIRHRLTAKLDAKGVVSCIGDSVETPDYTNQHGYCIRLTGDPQRTTDVFPSHT
ncbi:hypothetical protein X777_03682 [Ooceraea biroi]|uniref:Uncharacterized protein n=1 Tax=Ooceraea biroi TaxID=2015173 RepID=A0A026WIX8_OOCBI|nr:hypothetical protein X777_03682 [Ooceraea biroi]